MDYQISKACQQYADKGRQMGDSIHRALVKCEIVVLSKTPVSIEFIPWTISNSRIDDNISGRILWNPLNDLISIQYSLHLPFSKNGDTTFSRCLKWHLYKWNNRRPKTLRKLGISFVYPGTDNTEILLQTKCKVSLHQIDRKTRMFLLQMNDIIEKEGDGIISILSGDFSAEYKEEIFKEIFHIVSEMS